MVTSLFFNFCQEKVVLIFLGCVERPILSSRLGRIEMDTLQLMILSSKLIR